MNTIGNVSRPTFLTVPERGRKPRSVGITHVLDKGASVASTEAILASAAPFIDIWKFGWGTAYLDRALSQKLALLRAAEVRSCLGGTLLEIAWLQGKDQECLAWAEDVGFECVEVSRGVADLAIADKHDLVRRAAASFVVLTEVGRKDPERALTPREWSAEVQGDLETGARWVVAEGRESGTVGLYRSDGSVREDVVAAVTEVDGASRILFEAPRKDQQAWLIRAFGPEVNLANIALDEALALETLRLGLRADTCDLARQWLTV
jgi:phosphosulfolactate synthase